jgi:hypothetical protein
MFRPQKLAGKRIARKRVGDQSAQKPRIVARESAEDVQCRAQCVARRTRARRELETREHFVVELLQDLPNEQILRAEMVVKHPGIDAGTKRHFAYRQPRRARFGK